MCYNSFMKYDEYHEVINSQETFKEIGQLLQANQSVFIGWTDGEGTHFDILFIINPIGFGSFQGGVTTSDLFVSIMRVGSFGFEIRDTYTNAGYYEEKLARLTSLGSSREKLAELINGVKESIKTPVPL